LEGLFGFHYQAYCLMTFQGSAEHPGVLKGLAIKQDRFARMPGIFLTKLFEVLTTAIFKHVDAERAIEYKYS